MMLKDQIKDMQCKINNKIHYLNCGGCIQFAYYFTKRLKELNIPYKVYAFNHQAVGRTYKTFEPVSHVAVYIEGIGFIDGYNIFQDYHTPYKRNIILKDLDKLRQMHGWNDMYDKSQNRLLEETINCYINGN